MEGQEIWIAETWGAHGDGYRVQGIYDSREAAWDGLKGEVETLYVDERGHLRGRPRNEEPTWRPGVWFRLKWASAYPMKIQGRKQPALRHVLAFWERPVHLRLRNRVRAAL